MAWFFRGAEYSHLLLTSMGVASGLHSEKNKTTSICMPYLEYHSRFILAIQCLDKGTYILSRSG